MRCRRVAAGLQDPFFLLATEVAKRRMTETDREGSIHYATSSASLMALGSYPSIHSAHNLAGAEQQAEQSAEVSFSKGVLEGMDFRCGSLAGVSPPSGLCPSDAPGLSLSRVCVLAPR